MKKIMTTIVLLLYLATTSFGQNTADLFIENATINGSQTKFSWEIHITPTNDWGSNSGDKAIGDASWFFSYNGSALSNPVITFAGSAVDAVHYDNTSGITGGKVFVDTKIHNFDPGVDLTQGTKYHAYTVEMDIDNSVLESDLIWDAINTGILTATGNSINENYSGTGDVPLPVELSSFSATNQKGNVVNLQWETATEVNNYGFEVERSIKVEDTEDAEWNKISFIEGAGNSNSQKLYSFVDKNPVGGTKFAYRLKQIDIDGTFEYSDLVEVEVLPTDYELYQNYPNPFNPSTKIKFSLPEDAKVAVDIYNMLGQRVMTLFNKDMKAGYHQVLFDTQSAGNQLASGVYIYTISTKNFSSVKKMVLLK